MMYNITVQIPEGVSIVDANGLFCHLISVIQDLELEIAEMQHTIAKLSHPNEAEQLQLYLKCSNLPELIRDPVLCKLLAFNNISIEEWQNSVRKHLKDLDAFVNGEDIIPVSII